METRENAEINISTSERQIINKSWKPFLKQSLISSGIFASFFSMGLNFGTPTVLIPQLRKEANSTAAVSEDMASWMSSAMGYAAVMFLPFLCILFHVFGRKKTLMFIILDSLIVQIILYCAPNVTYVLISQIMAGGVMACHNGISPIILAEYTSPQHRGLFLTLKSACFYWGVWVSNAIGTFFHWRNIAIFGMLTNAYQLHIFMWPESPHWLASKGRFEECATAHRWLKGTDPDSVKELEDLIQSEKEILKSSRQKKLCTRVVASFKDSVTDQEFYKPLALCITLYALYQTSGKLACTIYAIEIIKKITNNEYLAYIGMLLLDGVTVISMYVGCVLVKLLRRRVLLLVSTTIAILCLFLISLYLYLVRVTILSENNIVSLSLLLLYSIALSFGPLIMSSSIYGELVMSRFKIITIFVTGIASNLFLASVVKISPYIIRWFGMHSIFMFYGIFATIFTLILYKYLPETKDKTLLEIEKYFRNSKKTTCEVSELILNTGKN